MTYIVRRKAPTGQESNDSNELSLDITSGVLKDQVERIDCVDKRTGKFRYRKSVPSTNNRSAQQQRTRAKRAAVEKHFERDPANQRREGVLKAVAERGDWRFSDPAVQRVYDAAFGKQTTAEYREQTEQQRLDAKRAKRRARKAKQRELAKAG